MNEVIEIGRITADPELRQTTTGIMVCKFNLAVERSTKDKKVDFIPIVAWRQSAEYLSKYAHKGDEIAVTGRLEQREWTDKEGKKRYSFEVNAETVKVFFGRKSNAAESSETPTYSQGADTAFEELATDDDLPF